MEARGGGWDLYNVAQKLCCDSQRELFKSTVQSPQVLKFGHDHLKPRYGLLPLYSPIVLLWWGEGATVLVAIFLEEWNGMVEALGWGGGAGQFEELNVVRDVWRLGEMGCPAVLVKELERVGVPRSGHAPMCSKAKAATVFPMDQHEQRTPTRGPRLPLGHLGQYSRVPQDLVEGQRGASSKKLELDVRFLGLRKDLLETPRKRGASINVKVRRACGIGHLHEPTTASHDRKGQLKMCPRELKASQDGGWSSETLLPSPSLPSPLTPPVGKGRRKRGGSYTTSRRQRLPA